MKNKFFLLAFLLAFLSCSDDDDNSANNNLTEYPVNYRRDASHVNSEIGESNPTFYNQSNELYKFGLRGLRLYSNSGNLLVSDGACPYEWDKNIELSVLRSENEPYRVKCVDCHSIFDLRSGAAVSGPAKDKGLKLVSYKIVKETGDYVFSNPRYKE